MQQKFRTIAKATLILVYLVIAAGAIVRMTGSGMGCPDWPKCFGYYIPPTEISEIQWSPNRKFKSGQVIIYNESLQVAKVDFTTSSTYTSANWEPYTKHEYAIFNPWHTWIEFINRLFGAVAGLATILMAYFSLGYWKKQKSVTIISILTVVAMGFQGWLGATVVYSVLEPAKITIHMIMALVIVAMLLYLIYATSLARTDKRKDNRIVGLLSAALFLSLIQIILGTQVRQLVDEQISVVGEELKNLWLANATVPFYIHRSFSILVVALNGYIFIRNRKLGLGYTKIKWVIAILVLEVISGIAMYYWDFPFTTQSAHLILASLLFGIQFYLVLEAIHTKKSHKTS